MSQLRHQAPRAIAPPPRFPARLKFVGTALPGIGLVVLAVMCFSTSAVLIRFASPLSPLEITFWRMVFATLTVGLGLLLVGRRAGPLPQSRRYIWFGLVAALHFLLFVASVGLTTIAHALAITYLSPVFTAIISWRFLNEGLSIQQGVGVAIAVAGIAVMVGFEPRITPAMLLGDALALLSACCYAIYSIAGRGERDRAGLLPYALTVYGLAAVWLIPALAAGFLGRSGGAALYTLPRIAALVGAGVVPLGLGHTLYNAGLRRIPATHANLIASQEVTGGIALGAALLHELPGAGTLAGAAMAVAGIVLVLA